MPQLTVPQMRGIKDLIQTAVDEAVGAIEAAHYDIARKPFVVLAWFKPIAMPARDVECVQQSITSSVYRSIRAANLLAGALATLVLEEVERRAAPRTADVERHSQR
jgi:hypothetical protein